MVFVWLWIISKPLMFCTEFFGRAKNRKKLLWPVKGYEGEFV